MYRKTLLFPLAFLFFLLFVSRAYGYGELAPNIYLKVEDYDTYVYSGSYAIYATKIEGYTDKIWFYNAYPSHLNPQTGNFWISVQNANFSITWFIIAEEFKGTIKDINTTGTLELGNVQEPRELYLNNVLQTRDENYTYDAATDLLTVTATSGSDVTFRVDWTTAQTQPVGPGPSPIEPSPITPPIVPPITPGPGFEYGVYVLLGVIGVAVAVAFSRNREEAYAKKIKRGFKKKVKRGRSQVRKKWKKKTERASY